MIDFTDEQIAARELRNAAYHEAGHKMLYERFGGAGDAVEWKNESGNPEETAWLGQFRPRICPEVMRKTALNHGFTAPELPANWKILVGMAGLLAEDTRTSFVRESFGHQEQAIELWKASRREAGYLGEWHSHPETCPSPSSVDVRQWQQFSLETSDELPLLAVIIGIEQFFVAMLRRRRAPVRLSALEQDDALDTEYVRTRL